MDLVFNEEQEELRRTVRRFLEDKSSEEEVRKLMETADGYDPAVWRQMAESLALQGLTISEEYGGSGYGYRELAIVLEEMGRAVLCPPYFSSVVLAANLLITLGDDDAKKSYLPRIADGSTIATVALLEPSGRWDEEGINLPAKGSGDGWTLTGEKSFVLDGHIADLILVAARSPKGISVFAVER